MIAASNPIQRPLDAKLLVVRRGARIEHWPRSALVDLLNPGDLVVANDAATLPASLTGTHEPTGRSIEVRLAGRRSLEPGDVSCFIAVIFGTGDYRTRTEDRPLPPEIARGDRLQLGPLQATVATLENHPRLVQIRFEGNAPAIWSALAQHGRPIQYAHVRQPLALWDIWTPIAGPPVAFEAPSAGFSLSWETVRSLVSKGVGFATLTHAAGISSTGDPQLDARLPFDEPYRIPTYTAEAIARAKERSARVIAVGTTVVRALEHAAQPNEPSGGDVRGTPGGPAEPDGPGKRDGQPVRAGTGVATQRIGPATQLRVVDALFSGTHERGTSHYELLRAFVSSRTLEHMEQQLDAHAYRTHEFGDSILVEKSPLRAAGGPGRPSVPPDGPGAP